MPNKRVLIIYSSSYGYVAEIALEISNVLEEKRLTTHLVDLRKIRRRKWPLLKEYAAILIGSSAGKVALLKLQAAVLNKAVRNFLTLKLDEIFRNNKILGVFKSDPYDLGVILAPEAVAVSLEQNLINQYGVKPSICIQFGPVIDLSRKSKLNAETKKSLRTSIKTLMKKTGLEFDMKGFNDFRDWERIREFAEKFAEIVEKSTGSSERGDSCPNCGIVVDSSWNFCTSCNYKLH